jgi:6-phosphogluconate dehydrogenase
MDVDRRHRRGRPGARPHDCSYSRFASRGLDDFADKLLSAMRSEFGGHAEKGQS